MTAVPVRADLLVVRPARVGPSWMAAGVVALAGTSLLGLLLGAVSLSPWRVVLEVFDHVPGLRVHSGLTEREAAIIWEIRMPRVALGMLVGATLAVAGSTFQGVFRNPLADPYFLGVSSGAGLGATLAIVAGLGGIGPFDGVPLAAFVGALGGITLTYSLARIGDRDRSPAVLLLAGIAVSSFLSAVMTFVMQRNDDNLRDVYSWLLGRLSTSGWGEVGTVLPYALLTGVVLLGHRRVLDVLAVGDDEASSLGLDVTRARMIVLFTASLAVAAAVSVSGLIAFVGIIVPHTIRLLVGSSYRVILPLSVLFGGAFLVVADILARTALAPAEVPIGVITAFFGAPFFLFVLRSRRVVPL